MSINNIFNIAKSSIYAHQQALSVASSNLANVNNPAYSRQVTMFGSMSPDHRANFSFGTGVKVSDVLRIRNNITDVQIRKNNHNFYEAQKKSTTLRQIETLFSESSGYGLSTLMTKFFNSWDELALDPQSSAIRTSVTQAGQSVSEKITNVYEGINETRYDVRAEAQSVVDNVNTIIEQIYVINKQIYNATAVNNSANDLIDTREKLLDDLSEFVSINVTTDEFSVASVSIGGAFAVDGLHVQKFELKQEDDKIFIGLEDSDTEANLSGGTLNALTDLFNNELPSQLKALEELTVKLMESVNDIHSTGYTVTDPPQTGVQFFTSYKNGVLEVNEDIIKDPYNIAISENGINGNNNIALKIAELKNEDILNGKTLSENYSELIGKVANEINLQEQNTESYGLVLEQLQQSKLEYSGVSTDEEMMNVMKYQTSYDAAAKLINVADELMQTILNMV